VLILGIDPGLTGGLGLVAEDGHYVGAWPMLTMLKNKSQREVNAAWLAETIHACLIATNVSVIELKRRSISDFDGKPMGFVVLERQRPFPDQYSQTSFSLGDSTGIVRGICAAYAIGLVYTDPHVWKKWARLPGKDKEAARAMAIRLYPYAPLSRKKDHGVAEALLIARWFALKGT